VTLPTHVSHLIVGAGFSGVGAAIKLQEAGERDFLVIERGHDVGGTWRDNTYPGAACDVPSQIYSYSFAPNPDWSSSYSPQPEIQAYIVRVARKAGILDRFVFDSALEDASWDESTQLWNVRTAAGPLTAEHVILGVGHLSEPKLPDIDGIDGFEGQIFHTARWDHSVDLTGKRIAVIGTGASAIQIIPELQKIAGHLDVYQRTAPWVIPRSDRPYLKAEKAAFRKLPLLQKAYREGLYWGKEATAPLFLGHDVVGKAPKAAAMLNIRRAIKDPALRAKVTPTFTIGCKRILISNAYYPALASDNVELVTDPISKVISGAVVTADGTERPIDVLVVATGFQTQDWPIAHIVRGRGGVSLAERWAESGMAAYKGTTIHGYPNLFQLYGPNVGLGHSSMLLMIESQITYVVDAITTRRSRGLGPMEPSAAAQDDWNADLQQRMARTVWSTGGCASWYLDAHGRNTLLWPRSTFKFRQLLSSFDLDAYDVEAPLTQEVTA
jgi:cation diffusion facilitator CzcD-associated flavoprotein CzcO